MEKTSGRRGNSGVGKLDALICGFSVETAVDWLRERFPSFETGSARKISIGESKGEKDYLASARLLGHITRLPEKSGDSASNRPLVVVAVEMKGDMTERTSRAGQFAFAKRVLRDAVNSSATGLDGLPSQGLFFFHDANGAFRISLVTGEVEGRRFKFNEAKRQSFFVRPGAANNIIRRRFHDPIKTFSDLKEAFSVEQLTKEFYRELFNWYEWAKDSGACFPNILNEPKDQRKDNQYNHEAIIRLITRLMFTWFIRQRNLVPDVLFDRKGVGSILKKFNSDSMVEDNYYRAILQNLFFATFNTPQSGKDRLTRRWIVAKTDARGNGVGLTSDYHVTTVYRYKDEFKDSDGFLLMMRKVPFLNCALFDCLDKIESKADGVRRMYFDGFSTKQERRAHVPNGLFFGDGEEGHMGIITLFDQYEFTIDENDVNDGDVALDPELLGKVFENLLGAYNPETQATARNATGSFYTPREIVDYMVEESLKNYLRGKLSLGENDSRLDELFDKGKAAEKASTGFSHDEEKAILEALYACRIIDPACGSGAFPMGILNCMVRLLKRLDDDTGTSIREYLLKRYREDKDRRDPTETEEDRQERLEEIEKRFAEGKMYPDYARKLYLIENCIYGVDIQPIATQISKLRFFISLLCDQFRTSYNPERDNYGLLSLPNLEAKFVCANTLIALPNTGGELDLTTGKVGELRDDLVLNRHKIFGARSTKTKEKYKIRDKEIRRQIREAVRDGLSKPDAGKIAQLERMIEQAKNRRREVEKPDWVEVERPVQQDFFAATSSQPMLMKVDRNADRRNVIDSEIDKCSRVIASEQSKGGKANIDAATKYADLVAGWDPFDQNASSSFFDPAWMFNIKDGFDIVIGNPPYMQVPKGEYSALVFPYSEGKDQGKQNLYKVFIEAGYNFAKFKGLVSFIVQSSLMGDMSAKFTRELLLTKTKINKVIEFPKNAPTPAGKVFKSVLQGTCIVEFIKESPESNQSFAISILNDVTTVGNFAFEKMLQSDVLRFYPDHYEFPLIKSGWASIVTKIKSVGHVIKEYLTDTAQGNINTIHLPRILSDAPTGAVIAKGIHIHRWNLEKELFNCVISEETEKIFASNRGKCMILSQNISGTTDKHRINAAPFECRNTRIVFLHSANILYLRSPGEMKFVTDILNSTLMDWMFRITSTNNHLNMYELEALPIPIIVADQQVPIIAKVDAIIDAKKSDPNAETSAFEKEIDALVYKLYGIIDEKEIAIIEGREGKNGLIENSAPSDAHHGGAAGVRAPVGGRAGSRYSRKPPRNDEDDEVLE